MDMFDWDDLRVLLALGRAGSISGAAEALGVSRSTIARRLDGLGASLGAVVYEHGQRGVMLTVAGEQLVPIAERIEAQAVEAASLLAGRDLQLSGRLDVTLFEIAGALLAPVFGSFAQQFPDIELRLFASDELRNLRRRESDLAVRATDHPDEDLFGRRLGRLEFALYGTSGTCRRDDPPWVLWDESKRAEGTWRYARQRSKRLHVAARVDNVELMVQLVLAGLGVAALPVVLAERQRRLVPLGPEPVPELGVDVWALTHPDLAGSARVRKLLSFLGRHAPALLGQSREPGAKRASPG